VDDSFFQVGAAISGGGGAGAFIYWLLRSAHRRIDGVEKRVGNCETSVAESQRDLAKHQVYAESAFAKGASIDRLHDRIDELDRKQEARTVRSDQKQDEILKLLIEQKK